MRWRTVSALMLASGFAGLGYQIVWTQQCALWLGHEAAAVLAVVGAFFGGLAAGALLLGPRIERSARPERWYAACEVLIALWSLALALLLAPISQAMLELIGVQPAPGRQWGVAFVGTFVLLLPATAAMGATLPAMQRITARLSGTAGQGIAALYACNTTGAVLGVLACAFWLVPQFGLARTAVVCAALNLACAAVALRLSAAPRAAVVPAPFTLSRRQGVPMRLFVSGLLGIGYEVLVVRVLSQVAEDTVYTFAMLLAVYLVGTAAGAAAYQRWLIDVHRPDRVRDRLVFLQAATCLLGAASLWGAEQLKGIVLLALGPGMAPALAAEATLALAAFALPTMVMGALFSHLVTQAHDAGIGVGRALGVNTVGAALAPLLFGVWLAPLAGPKFALLMIAAGYLAISSRAAWRAPAAWALAAAGVALAVWAPPLAFIDLPDGGRVLSYRDGPMAAVSVVEDAEGVARLRINNRQQEGSSATLLADARQALLPLWLHPQPKRALFLGLGTGMTASSATVDPALQVDVVELLPEVIEASGHFTKAFSDGVPQPRLQVMAADARRFVRTTAQRYDVIVADNFHPARSGSGTLYTVEHFQAVRDRLSGQGVFCQWLPLHQLDLDTLRSIVQSFVAVYPGGAALLATNSLDTPVLGLVARRDDGRFELQPLRTRLAHAGLTRPLADFGIHDDFALLGGFVAGPQALRRFAGSAPLNTDDRPVVVYSAPRITYAPDSMPRDRLLALLRELDLTPAEVIVAGADTAWSERLSAYWKARDQFIEAGRHVQASANPQRMLDQVREPLLSVLRTSPDFRPAYDPLLRMAVALGRSDEPGARALLTALQQVQPARPEAAQALSRWADLPR